MYTVTCNDSTVQNTKHVPDEVLLGRRFLWISRVQVSRTWWACTRTFMGPSYE